MAKCVGIHFFGHSYKRMNKSVTPFIDNWFCFVFGPFFFFGLLMKI